MSLPGLIDLAVTRGQGDPQKRRRFGKKGESEKAVEEAPAGLGVLLSAIPVEIITLYTAFAATTITRVTPSAEFLAKYKNDHGTAFAYEHTRDLILWRWTVYAALAVAVIGVVYGGWAKKRDSQKDKRKAPFTEMAAGAIGFGAWGLTMPGGLLAPYVRTQDLSLVTLAIITIVAAGMIALGWGVLKNQASNTT